MSPTARQEAHRRDVEREAWPRLLESVKRGQAIQEYESAALRAHAMDLAPSDPTDRARTLVWVAVGQSSLQREIVEHALVAAASAGHVSVAVDVAHVLAASDWWPWWAVRGVLQGIAWKLDALCSGDSP